MLKEELKRKIRTALKHKNLELPKNAGAKEGLIKAVEILESGQKGLSGIEDLSCDQARAIAMFAVDFNNLKESGKFFEDFIKALTEEKKGV